jgi:hypothetical protein
MDAYHKAVTFNNVNYKYTVDDVVGGYIFAYAMCGVWITLFMIILTGPLYTSFNPHGCDTTLYTLAFVSIHGLYLIVLSTGASILIIWGVFALIKNTLGYLLNLVFNTESRQKAYAWCARTFTQTCNDTCGCYYTPLHRYLPTGDAVMAAEPVAEIKLEICEDFSS